MSETPEQQRVRLFKKREAETDDQLIPCLECSLKFKRVGSHVVQVHGYESALEYRREHGLMGHETRLQSYADNMRAKVGPEALANLERGKDNRYKVGDDHAERVSKFWANRKKKSEYKKLNSNLRGKIKI